MKKWIVLGIATLFSFSVLASNDLSVDQRGSKLNPASMAYYVEHYKNANSKDYQTLLIGVRVAADAINFYTTRLDERNQRIDYCLPMRDPANREALWHWKTEDLMALINNHIEHDPAFKKYGRVSGSIGSYLAVALKAQYPCPAQKQL